jgi:pseudouridine-5'-phosphate glycosidase
VNSNLFSFYTTKPPQAAMNLSTDLVELEGIPIAVVCANAEIKSTWNIKETLEYEVRYKYL